jgi:Leu/Phe-tRNA-protein transferase
MHDIKLHIDYLSYKDITDNPTLENIIYPNMYSNYYWSDDFSARYYIAQAKAGFISVTEGYEGRELLIPEIQYRYAILDFKNLHISRKVQKLVKKKRFQLEISSNLDDVFEKINKTHKNSWLTTKYLATLKETENLDENFRVISVAIKEDEQTIAGELGYTIGKTYTSLSGFSNRDKRYRNYGTVQLVLLAKYLQQQQFSFWNLGQPYMDYKMALGAKIYERKDFLKRWFSHR